MSILIKGMEMPQRCRDCCFAGFVFTCHLAGKTHDDVLRTRPDWCPLVPLPEGHGRLGDLDVLYEVAKTRSMGIYGPCNAQCVITGDDILKAPTIVPAEGGNSDGN